MDLKHLKTRLQVYFKNQNLNEFVLKGKMGGGTAMSMFDEPHYIICVKKNLNAIIMQSIFLFGLMILI